MANYQTFFITCMYGMIKLYNADIKLLNFIDIASNTDMSY